MKYRSVNQYLIYKKSFDVPNFIILVYDSPRDLLLLDDRLISIRTNVELSSVKLVKLAISNIHCLSPKFKGHESMQKFDFSLKFGDALLDQTLAAAIPQSSITEIYGPAGSGKTQLCLKAVSYLLKSDTDVKVLYISTQERFNIERLVLFLALDNERSESYLDRVHLEYFLDPNVELHFFEYSLLQMMEDYDYKIIIYDGIASNSRNIENMFEKSEHINRIIAAFRRVFMNHNCTVLITNQVTDIPGDSDSNINSALGLTFENNVNIKTYLKKIPNSSKRKLIIQKSLSTPTISCYLDIDESGIKGILDKE